MRDDDGFKRFREADSGIAGDAARGNAVREDALHIVQEAVSRLMRASGFDPDQRLQKYAVGPRLAWPALA